MSPARVSRTRTTRAAIAATRASIATDDVQGAAGAEWAKTQGKTKAYVLDDTRLYGAGLAKAWALARQQDRPRAVVSPNKTSESFDAKATDYNAALWPRRSRRPVPTSVYIGSITGQNTGKLWKDLQAALPDYHDHVR